MSGLLRRLRPAREPATGPGDDAPTESLPAQAFAPVTADAPPAAAGTPAEPVVQERPLPAGIAPEELVGEPPDTRRRGRLRRRLRHLRRVRELMLRDVGGLVYELHRAGEPAAPAGQGGRLVEAKLERLGALDAERVELETMLGDTRAVTILREPGVGGTCPACGEYHASDAHFCATCGARVDGRTPPATAAPRTEPDHETEPAPAAMVAPAPAEAPAGAEAPTAAESPAPIEPQAEPEAGTAAAPSPSGPASGAHPREVRS
jgi:hypothetical protein